MEVTFNFYSAAQELSTQTSVAIGMTTLFPMSPEKPTASLRLSADISQTSPKKTARSQPSPKTNARSVKRKLEDNEKTSKFESVTKKIRTGALTKNDPSNGSDFKPQNIIPDTEIYGGLTRQQIKQLKALQSAELIHQIALQAEAEDDAILALSILDQ